MAEARDGEEHKSSMALWDVLMTWREDWTKCGRSPKGLDKRIASVFDPNTHGQVRECIKMVEILHDMEKQLDILRLDKFGLRCGLDYILDTASQYAFETRVIRWNELIKARKRMVEVGLETQCIDEKITNVFKVSIFTESSYYILRCQLTVLGTA